MGFKREHNPLRGTYRCTGCGEWKDYYGFYENALYKYGITARCKTCINTYHKERYRKRKQHEEEVAEVLATYRPERWGPPVTDEDLSALTGDHTQS
jgi:hypothetical protein